MRITKKLLQETIDTLNDVYGLPVGHSYDNKNFFLCGAMGSWKLCLLKDVGQEEVTRLLTLKELYFFVSGMIRSFDLTQKLIIKPTI